MPSSSTLAAIGTADEANAVIDRYFEAGATSPGVGPDREDGLRGDAARAQPLSDEIR